MSSNNLASALVTLVGVLSIYHSHRIAFRLRRIYSLIDEINSQDPRDPPIELEYGKRMTRVLERYDPNAQDTVKIACRAQHIARWRIPRTNFPEGKVGYLNWRKSLYALHSEIIRNLLDKAGGFSSEEITKIGELVGKEWDFKNENDPDAHAVEDVAALVFLEFYFPAFTDKLNQKDKIVDIVRKTWRKMSEKGKQQALNLNLPPAQLEIVVQAINSGDST